MTHSRQCHQHRKSGRSQRQRQKGKLKKFKKTHNTERERTRRRRQQQQQSGGYIPIGQAGFSEKFCRKDIGLESAHLGDNKGVAVMSESQQIHPVSSQQNKGTANQRTGISYRRTQ
ncbi:hypothetical protein CIHG_08690 [Coccidioides immitis H538.4]|uniref:Uncharacterized protein n=3 Tax=Coccidioides immitis TaxID=5501 RepID=A0A0J8QZA0_COCIT|nr:hypothetical protein CIRG_02633 [Coccidioides immitis RMSCC 2394]KMU77385.1 hypothetical protein CISG_06632 [Coccidioides immitis RMSCC 3703]KMU90730.1 hypothetical protein CIHG_08690 [Coccidioides immitis H538.4]